ncbi:MAG: rubredoxin [Gammaproteobacteria bacterium]
MQNQQQQKRKKYICLICSYIYDEALGWPEDNIPPGTKWEDVPVDWTCPDCGARKEDFNMVEI